MGDALDILIQWCVIILVTFVPFAVLTAIVEVIERIERWHNDRL